MHAATIRRTDQRTGGRELQPLVPKRRLPEVPVTTGRLSQRDIRPDGGVLEAKRRGSAPVRRDPSFPSAQKFGVYTGSHTGFAQLSH